MPSEPREVKLRRRWVKWAIVVVAVVLVLGVVLVLALPSILSSAPGKRLALSFVNASIPGKAANERPERGLVLRPAR